MFLTEEEYFDEICRWSFKLSTCTDRGREIGVELLHRNCEGHYVQVHISSDGPGNELRLSIENVRHHQRNSSG
jgi:hypothetical protein